MNNNFQFKTTIIAFFASISMYAQTTETFETESIGSASFTDNGQVFNITSQAQGPFDVYDFAGGGWNGSAADNRFIDNSGGASANTNPQFTISSSGATPFILNNFYLFVSDQALTMGVSGSVTITGKLAGATVYTATQSSGFVSSFATNNGFTFINLATFGGQNNSNKNIDQIIISAVDNFNYLALDAFNWSVGCPTLTLNLASSSNVSCNGGSNGSATVSASGGTSFTYTWSPTGGNSATASSLSAGTYTCNATNQCGSTASRTVSITQPTILSLTSASQTNISCNGGNNGAASVNIATGGAGGYTYNWTPGNPTGDGTVSISGLTAGTWTCTVTDANSCTATRTFTITQPTLISVTAASQTNISCNGGSNGAASINTPTGGAGGYTYNWTPGNPTGDGTVSVTGLTAGTWTCTVTDANSCTAQTTFNITQPTAITLNANTQTNVSCFGGSNGAASVLAATGGAGGYTYNWTPGNPTGDGTVSVTGLTAGTWTCTVTDANSCTATRTFTITQPTSISVTAASQTNISCNGGSNGAASINTPTGGAGGYTYNWTPGNPTGDGTVSISGLTAGTWTCTVTDANSCTAQTTFNITAPTAISVTAASQTNISCNGGSNGTASVTASGGTGSYTYNWTPGNPTGDGTPSITGLTAGTWTCTVTDANSCVATRTVSITQPAPFTTTINFTNATCYGVCNGTMIAIPMGGTAPYTYNWSNGLIVDSDNNACAGSYTVNVQDANGCTATESISINEPPVIEITLPNITNIYCNGGNNGSITISASGGTGALLYDWAPGTPTGDGSNAISNLVAGSYTCNVTDENNCTISEVFTINQPTALTTTLASSTNVSCNGGNNGTASVTASGGTTTYSYNWTPGNPTGDGTPSVTGLTAGTWTCTITDANSCVATRTVSITQPTALTASLAASNNVSCNGGSNGTASVTASGGTTTYSYNWTPGNPTGDGTPSVTGLTTGTWTCTITDAASCTTTQTVSITQPTALTSSLASSTNVSCNSGSNGTASVSVNGGTTSYSYNWTPGNPTGDGSASVTGLTAGTWTCTITDAALCTTTQTVSITQPTALAATIDVTNPTCNGICNGTVMANPTGGILPYSYAWCNGMTTQGSNSMCAGTCFVTIQDANGCTITQTISVNDPLPITVNSSTSSDALCYNGNTGAATVNASGGTGTLTYEWLPDNPSGDGTNSINGLTAGTYTCIITDVNICSTTHTTTIFEPTDVSITSTQSNISCNGLCDASIATTATGGTGGFYTYQWASGATTPNKTNMCEGTDTLIVTDFNGCTDTTIFTITAPEPLTLTLINNTNNTCNGGQTGSITMSASGGTPNYTFNWTPGNPTGNGTPTISNLAAGSYTCELSDSKGCYCLINQIVDITEPPAITYTQNLTLCNGDFITVGSNTYNTSGNFTDILVASNGCDSTVITNLTVNEIDITTTTSGTTISSNSPFASHQWIDCDNGNLPIPGETNPDFVATTNGNYAVIVTIGSCSDTSACVSINSIGLNEARVISKLNISPNPSSGIFKINNLTQGTNMNIYNALGEIVKTLYINNSSLELDITTMPDGVYIIRTSNNQFIKLVKQF